MGKSGCGWKLDARSSSRGPWLRPQTTESRKELKKSSKGMHPAKPDASVAVFLGAGASAAEGAPTQANLFRDYFGKYRHLYTPAEQGPTIDSYLIPFFQTFFNINVDGNNLTTVQFPTFEEALGVVE